MKTLFNPILKPSEIQIRKRWWIITIFSFCLPHVTKLIQDSVEGKPNAVIIGNLLGAFIATSIFLASYYHCTYKKYGTKLLTYSLFAGPLFTILSFFFYPRDLLTIISGVLSLGVYIYWYALSLKVRRINKKAQFQRFSLEEYLNSVNSIESATTKEDLELIFTSEFQKWKKYQTVLHEVYLNKKASL